MARNSQILQSETSGPKTPSQACLPHWQTVHFRQCLPSLPSHDQNSYMPWPIQSKMDGEEANARVANLRRGGSAGVVATQLSGFHIYRNSSKSCSEIQSANRWAKFQVQCDSYLPGSSRSHRSCQDSAVWTRTAHGHGGIAPWPLLQQSSFCPAVIQGLGASPCPTPTAFPPRSRRGQDAAHTPRQALPRWVLPRWVWSVGKRKKIKAILLPTVTLSFLQRQYGKRLKASFQIRQAWVNSDFPPSQLCVLEQLLSCLCLSIHTCKMGLVSPTSESWCSINETVDVMWPAQTMPTVTVIRGHIYVPHSLNCLLAELTC